MTPLAAVMENQTGTIQYWLEVHRIGSLLFENIESADDALKTLITSVLGTPFLSDIECLSGDSPSVPCPFTTWLLQGLLKAYVCSKSDDFVRFYFSAQWHLLVSAKLEDFGPLMKLYIDALNDVLKLECFSSDIKFLLLKDYHLEGYDRKLVPASFEIRNKKEQIHHAKAILEVIASCPWMIPNFPDLSALWELLVAIMNSNVAELKFRAVSILTEIIRCGNVGFNEDELKNLGYAAMSMIDDDTTPGSRERQKDIVTFWRNLKKKINVTSIYDDVLFRKLLAVKGRHTNFVYDELSSMPPRSAVPHLTENDEICVRFGSVLSDVERFLSSSAEHADRIAGRGNSEGVLVISVKDASPSWREIVISSSKRLRGNGDVVAYVKNLVEFCCKAAWKLDEGLRLARHRIVPSFFGRDLGTVADRMLTAVKSASASSERSLAVPVKVLSDLLNLPEAELASAESLRGVLDFLVTPLASDPFHVPCWPSTAFPLADSTIPRLFLRSLQSVEIPATVSRSLWRNRGAIPGEHLVQMVPVLVSRKRMSPGEAIERVLLPALSASGDVELQVRAVNSFRDLMCALGGSSYVVRNDSDDLVVRCEECASRESRSRPTRESSLVEGHVERFIAEVTNVPEARVKLRLIDNLHRSAVHLSCLTSASVVKSLLRFLEDDDERIRSGFAGCVAKLVFGEDRNSLRLVLAKVQALLLPEVNTNCHAYGYSKLPLLETITQIACVSHPSKRHLESSILILLLFINQADAPLPAIFTEVAAAHRTTPLVLYYSHRPAISKFLGNFVAANRCARGWSLRTTLADVNAIFKGLSESRFAAGSESYILPILIARAPTLSVAEELLCEWSEYVDQPLAVVIRNTFHNIYTEIMLQKPREMFDRYMEIIERLTELKVKDLLLHSQKSIINELLFNHHRSPERVVSALKDVLGGLNPESSVESVVDALEARFVGYLLFIVRKFVKGIIADSEKVHAVLSLTSVIRLMGRKHVTPVARKVLATLQTTLSFNLAEHHVMHFQSVAAFVEMVDVKHLAPLLPTIITLLVPFLDYEGVRAESVFEYLVVENEGAVRKFLPSLIFLPQHSKLNAVNAVLAKYIDFDKETLRDRLVRETSLALHETVYIRAEGLKALCKTIESSEMQNLIAGSDEPDPSIRKLLEGLILCCSDPDRNISVLAATCLGRLGAIDPGLLPRKPKPKNQLPLSVHDPEFAFLALTEMTRGFQNARKSVEMDAFAVAIQELLKMYLISPAEDGIWSRFPKDIQGLMTPMLSSRYKVQAPMRDPLPEVVFGSKEANSHVSWASLWASKLIGHCKDDRAVILFKFCEPSLRCDVKVLLFFLRYILLHAIIRDPSVHEGIIKEIDAVVKWSGNTVESGGLRTRPRPVRMVGYCGYPSMKSTITPADAQTCAMTVFLLLDFLNTWLRIYRDVNFSAGGEQSHKKDFLSVKAFLDKIDYLRISIANYEIREYARSIMYLEDVIGRDVGKLREHLPLLSKVYALYGDLDSVASATAFQEAAPKLDDLLLSHRVSGRIEEVRIIFEMLGRSRLMTPAHMREMSRCYLDLGEPYTAVNCIRSFASQQPDLVSLLSEGMVESLLKLGDWESLTRFLDREETASHADWFVQMGRIILGLRDGDDVGVSRALENVRTDVANALRQTGLQFGDYQQCYPYLMKLQMLREVEDVAEVMRGTPSSVRQLARDWDTRSGFVQSDPSCLEPLLALRRILLGVVREKLPAEAAAADDEIARSWVKSAEIARKAGCFHQSYNFILNAEKYNNPSTFIEKAQLLWDKGDQDLCLLTLSRGIGEFFPASTAMKSLPAGERLDERRMCAEAKLLYAIYNEETSNCDHNANITNYQDAFDVCRQLEKSQAFLALCLDRVVSQLEEHEQSKKCELKVLVVHHCGKSLMRGCEYIYQTVPRMLSIWLDLGEAQDTPEKANALSRINKLIEYFLEELPPFIFMTALPQLISRIGHPNPKVLSILKNMLATLVKAFPQQCLWALQAIAKSSIQPRAQRYNEFILHPMLRSATLVSLIKDFTSLCDELNKLANYRLSQHAAFRGLKVSSILRHLPRLLSSQRFSAIILPVTRFCSISLPKNVGSMATHEAFPKDAVYITGLSEEVTVLPSLQKPRKISFRGSDGNLYDILCKPTDDLRRDGRLMEFNNIVNMYLHRDAESRARGLHIRTYVVIPLGEEGGLIEWVPNLVGLRKVLIRLYKQFGKYTKPSELKTFECKIRDPLEKKRSTFVEKLLPLHPPLFPEWFRTTFPDPSGWYLARQSYTRTTAVMSMVGYILGLGDRHGENILFDCESGDTVHVDFNCLFNKGETMDWKERVPFRLTHNMVAAMGPFGVEGTFRKSCEMSLRVLRSQAKTLTSVLRPFAYDPCGSWGKNKEIVQNERDQKMGEAHRELSDIEKRLNGSLRVKQKNSTLYLSVEGQARSLIVEATDVDNLCQMYFGWGAYL